MVPRVSKNMCACMEKPTGGKAPGTRGIIPCSTTQVNICSIIYFKDTLNTSPSLHLATFYAPTSYTTMQVNSCNWLFLQLWCPLHPSLLFFRVIIYIQVPSTSDKDPSSSIMVQHPIQCQFYHLYMTHVKLNCC